MTPVSSDASLPPVFTRVLRRLRDDAEAIFGDEETRIEPVAYQARPFSNVVRLRVVTGAGSPVRYCFAKVQTPKAMPDGEAHMSARVRHEFETTAKVERALAGLPGMEALHPVACYPDLFSIVTEEIRGVTLLQYLEKRLSRFATAGRLLEAEHAAARAGEWLRAFQTIDPADDLVEMDELREYIDVRLQKLVSSGQSPISVTERKRCLKHIGDLSAAVPQEDWRNVIVHADLAPGNVMVTERGVAVLDFAMASRGTRLQDITRLALQIDLMRGKPWFTPAAVRHVTHALLEGFAAERLAGQPLFRLLTLRHRINHLATLTLSPSSGLARLYRWRLRRMHERAIAHELATPVGASAAARHDAAPER